MNTKKSINLFGLCTADNALYNLSVSELINQALENKEGQITDTGAIMCDTGAFTGRSPKDKYFVKDDYTANKIWWEGMHQSMELKHYNRLLMKMSDFAAEKQVLYVMDVYACAHPSYKIAVRVIGSQAYHSLFSHNMFIRPNAAELAHFVPEYTVLCLPEFVAIPAEDGTRQANFSIINLTQKTLLIGGTGYTGEIKKGMFSVLNFTMPTLHDALPMHCAANLGEENQDTAIFFGLSGTGKTTLSADPERRLIGDDEHGWAAEGVFNFEGGCYAKVIDITQEQEPQIWAAIRTGAVLENTRFLPNTTTVDYTDVSVTQNTRVSYPINYILGAVEPSVGPIPKNIFFLTADAFGVLPPISRLSEGQAMYHFISGYTAKVAGTEMGIKEPVATFSACFGEAFLPLHPTVYAQLLGQKLKAHETKVWLINTGWIGGAYGTGSRIKLAYTRAMISAALAGQLDNVAMNAHPVFGVNVPESCPGVPSELLNPRSSWSNAQAYDKAAAQLAGLFVNNFEPYLSLADEQILAGAPKV